MKKMAKAAALIAAMVLAAGLTACQGKGSSKGLVIDGAKVTGYTPDVPAKLSVPKGVTEIDGSAFQNCLTLVSVTIPNTVANIGGFAFSECKNLKSVSIPGSVEDTGFGSFNECKSLESVTIGDGVKRISTGSFMECDSLKSVTIPASVTEIDLGAFCGCTSLASVTIPASVTKIGAQAFGSCDKLEVKYAGTKEQWEEIEVSARIEDSSYGKNKFVVHCKDGDVTVE
ncbi:MAG: leucine-rich repeat domain-containing protein [Treponema sp.]|nr:leucine-rich repeat domain-containing protein [Treponema sp.]